MVSYAAVITNGHIRPLVAWVDLPDEVKADFDYLDRSYSDAEVPRFVRYLGSWHDMFDAQTIAVAPAHTPYGFNVHPAHPLAGWNGIATTSHWTGTTFRFPTEEEAYDKDIQGSDRFEYAIVGRYVA